MLPTHVGQATPRKASSPAGFASEKRLLIIVFVAFCVVCFGGFFFVPDLSESLLRQDLRTDKGDGHDHAHLGVRYEEDANGRHGGLTPPNPLNVANNNNNNNNFNAERDAEERRKAEETRKLVEERERRRKADREHQEEDEERRNKERERRRREQEEEEKEILRQQLAAQKQKEEEQQRRDAAAAAAAKGKSYDSPQNKQRREFVRGMMKRAWDGYVQYAWGHNELMPISKRGHSAGIFGQSMMGATIVDALDTLYIMGFTEEFKKARDWVATSLDFNVNSGVSVFEITIRFVGGLLSAYALTGDSVFKDKALDIATRLLPAFDDSPYGIPKAMINLQTGSARNWGWASGGASILSEFGTMQLEFEYLSQITGKPEFGQKAKRVMDYVVNLPKPSNGMYANYLHPNTGTWGSNEVSLGALGDSFYEYLIKVHVFHGGRSKNDLVGRRPFDDAMRVVREKLVQVSPSKLTYIAEAHGHSLQHKMGHLACFAGGMFALGSKNAPDDMRDWYMTTGANIAHTCHESYARTRTKLGPEAFLFESGIEATMNNPRERYYILRPEVIETYFVMWRMTHDQKYRDWAWEAVEALENHCRCGVGYCGIKDVDELPAQQDDVQQSFFLAETLKYLYLIFSEDDVISLDEWVLNTEAHPMPISK